MDAKLTLKLDKGIIEKAKSFAKEKQTSLSKLIEHYLEFITSEKEENQFTPLVNELSGIINIPDDYDLKKDYTAYLSEKHNI